jgi:hypothetical protein
MHEKETFREEINTQQKNNHQPGSSEDEQSAWWRNLQVRLFYDDGSLLYRVGATLQLSVSLLLMR